jgi:cell wall-associated NlpC family hydrolase
MRSATRGSPLAAATGDLVFVYNGGGGRVGHVAIYAGGGKWWEASNPRTGVGLHKAGAATCPTVGPDTGPVLLRARSRTTRDR